MINKYKFLRLRCFLKAAFRRYFSFFFRFRTPPKFLVISPGGVGTTFLMAYIVKKIPGISLNHIHDNDGFKHMANFPWLLSKHKILYVNGDINDIVNSISRRGWVLQQSAKLGCSVCQLLWNDEHLERSFIRAIKRQMNYFKSRESSNLMVTNYEDLWLKAEDIAIFFEAPDVNDFCKNFPKRKSRFSSTNYSQVEIK